MTGFPKTFTDFSNYKKTFSQKREWQNCFEKQAGFYLDNLDFFSKKTEGWKYFPFQKIMKQNFVFNSFDTSLHKEKSFPNLSPSLLISVHNGRVLSSRQQMEGFSVNSWKDFLMSKTDLDSKTKETIFTALTKQRNPFCSLSNTMAIDGLIIVVKKTLKQPLEIHYTHSDTNDQQGINLRNFIFVKNNTSAQIVEIFYGRKENKPLFFNIQTDCFISEKASLEHSRVDQTTEQDTVINQLFTKLSPSAKACFFSLSLNAGIGRWMSELEQEEKSSSEIRGLSLLERNKYADHKVAVSHKGIEGTSHQLYKSFLFDSAKQIFQGWTSIGKQAQRSSVSQLSKNFLFGKRAFAVAFPELDITADDVKASHGATVSPFSENKDLVFYLQSRGIHSFQAFHLILSSLMKEVFSGLQENTEEFIQLLVQKKLNSLAQSMDKTFQ